MYLLEFLIYQLRPFGLEDESRPSTPEPPPDVFLNATPWVLPDDDSTTSTSTTTTTTIPTTSQPEVPSTEIPEVKVSETITEMSN